MYAPSIVLDKIARFNEKYGWPLVEHSPDEIDAVNKYIASRYRTAPDGSRYFDDSEWTPRLVRFVQNERALCALSTEYYLTRYFYISAQNRIQRFSFRSGQRAFFSVVQDLEARGQSIEIQVLKARQLGVSTLVEGLMSHSALFIPGAKCSIGSADEQKTYVMMNMMYEALENLPWWLPPARTKDKRSGRGLLEFSHIGTSIVVQSGSMKGGIGQGTTPTRVHLSECCDFTDPVTQIEEGLFKAVHSGPEIFMVLESTGNGNTGWWADQWRNNKEFYWQGRARLLPLFLPWFTTPELYPTPNWIKKFPVPGGWQPAPETVTMTNKCELYAHSTDILARILGAQWKLPREQQWFWEFNYQDARRRRTEKSWLRQMPCDDMEALVGDNDSVFDWETIQVVAERRKRGPEVYGIAGEGIAERHDPPPSEVRADARHPWIQVDWTTPNAVKLQWTLLPMLGDPESPSFDPLKKLLVYEHPQAGSSYSIGVDAGQGVGGDRTVISVTKVGSDSFPDVQVAEWASDDIDNVAIYAWAMAIAAYYATAGGEDDKPPKFVIEQRRRYGDSCYHALKLHGFRNHHKWREYDKVTLKPKPTAHAREGFFTNAWSRPMLLGYFKAAVDNGWYTVNSKWLLAEIEGFEQRFTTEGKTRMDHQAGKHDDRIFAAAMSYFSSHDMDILAERMKIRYAAPADDEWVVDLRPWLGPEVKNEIGDDFLREYGMMGGE